MRKVVEKYLPCLEEERSSVEPCAKYMFLCNNLRNDDLEVGPRNSDYDEKGRKAVYNMSNMFKIYHRNEDCYRGYHVEICDRQILLIEKRHRQYRIEAEEKPLTFSIMLKATAFQYYFDTLQDRNMRLVRLLHAVKTRFINAEHTLVLTREWDNLILQMMLSTQFDNIATECLELLVKWLKDIQFALSYAYRLKEILQIKLFNEVKDIDACNLAY